MKWASVGLVVCAIWIAAWVFAGDASSFLARAVSKYVASLERSLRPLFIFVPGRRILTMQAIASLVCVALGLLMNEPLFGVGMLAAVVAPKVWIRQQASQRTQKLETQLSGFLMLLSNALKANPSIGSALASIAGVLEAPFREEVELLLKELKVGSSVEQAFLQLAARTKSRQVDSAVSIVLIGRQVGGDLGKVLATSAASLREMNRLEGVLRSKTSEARAQLWVLGALPPAAVFGMNSMQPGFFEPLTADMTGYMVGAIASIFWVASLLWARAIMAVNF